MKKIILITFLFMAVLSCEKECVSLPEDGSNCWVCTFYKSDPFPILMCGYTEDEIKLFSKSVMRYDPETEIWQTMNCVKVKPE